MTAESPDAPTPPPPPRRRFRATTWLVIALGVVLCLVVAVAAAAGWAVGTAPGSAWLLSKVPGLKVDAPRGALAGDFGAREVVVDLPGGQDRVRLTDLGWHGLSLRRGDGGRWAHVTLEALSAGRVDVMLAPKPDKKTAPPTAPRDLRLPVEVELKSLRVGEIHATPLGDTVVTALDAALHLGADAGAVHRVDHLGLRVGPIGLEARAQVGSAGPMAVEATVDASQAAAGSVPAWTARLHLAGPLAEPVLDARLRASAPIATSTSTSTAKPAAAAADRAQSFDLHAALRPFAPWPLGDLTASAKALDLSAFVAAAPSTALDLEARATSSGADRPAVVTADLTNAAAGRYDDLRLPVRSAHAEVAVRPDRATEIELRSATLELGPAGESAGKVTVQGQWSPSRWQFDAALDGLQPQRLDGRAPPMRLSGPVRVAGGGAAADGRGIDLKTGLTGRLEAGGRAQAVEVKVDAALDLAGPDKRVRVALLQATAGNTGLKATGTATQADPAAAWAVKAEASVADFDPGAWLGGAARSPWRGTKNRINARAAVDASAVLPAAGQPALDALAAARGQATLAVHDTVLAGVPLEGKAAVQSRGDNAHLQADFAAAGNSVHVDGRAATRGKGGADAFDLALDAPALAALAPVYKLFQAPGADATLAGRVTAHAHVDGRWPRVTTRGDLDAQGLQAGPLGLQRATGQWTAGTAATDRVSLDLAVDELRSQPKGGPPGPSLERLTVQLAGTARAHTLDLRATSRARPPAWAEAATDTLGAQANAAPAVARSSGTAAPPARLTVATLHARGGGVDQKDAALAGWRGTLESVEVTSNTGRGAPLLRAQDLALEAFWGGGPFHAEVQPGRLELLGGALRWTRLRYAQAPAGSTDALPRVDVDATIEPLRVAPLLAQAQPDFGWGGDLAIGGHVRLQSGGPGDSGVKADVLVERSGGDLSITDEIGTRRLGLTGLRVGLQADRGRWNVSTRLVGQTLGTVTADAAVQTSPQALVPTADAPLSGRIDLDVADLAGLGNWVPSGWRVGGALRAGATLGGRLGQPEYEGQLAGSRITARNFLEGVSATDGDLLVRLSGTTATIDHFTANGGDGSLRITGAATFDATPTVDLDITATRFQVLGRIDRKIVASGHAAVRVDARRVAVTGGFGVDQGLIDITRSDAPALAPDVTVTRAPGVLSPAAAASAAESPGSNAPVPTVAVAGPPAAAPPPAQRAVDLNLKLDLGSQLAIRGHGLAARLAGTLAFTSPDSKVAVNGTVSVVDGTFKAYGQDLVIDRGMIVFTGPIDRPRLDIEATRPKLENMRVGVTITGSVANPRIRLFSEPDVSDVDKLSWLVVGRGSDNLGRNESALLQSAAMALVSGEGNGEPGMTERVSKALGLDELSLGQTDGAVKQTVVNLGKQLSDRWSIGYQAGLNATAGSVQLIFRIAKRLTVRAQAGTASSLDFVWSWRWQ